MVGTDHKTLIVTYLEPKSCHEFFIDGFSSVHYWKIHSNDRGITQTSVWGRFADVSGRR